jgi:hypothetical protein
LNKNKNQGRKVNKPKRLLPNGERMAKRKLIDEKQKAIDKLEHDLKIIQKRASDIQEMIKLLTAGIDFKACKCKPVPPIYGKKEKGVRQNGTKNNKLKKTRI